jgi:hypothetical protein
MTGLMTGQVGTVQVAFNQQTPQSPGNYHITRFGTAPAASFSRAAPANRAPTSSPPRRAESARRPVAMSGDPLCRQALRFAVLSTHSIPPSLMIVAPEMDGLIGVK